MGGRFGYERIRGGTKIVTEKTAFGFLSLFTPPIFVYIIEQKGVYIIEQKGGDMRGQSVKVRLSDVEYWYLRRAADREGVSVPQKVRQILREDIIAREGEGAAVCLVRGRVHEGITI